LIINDIYNSVADLAVIKKGLSPEAKQHLIDEIKLFMSVHGDDMEVVLPYIILYVYNEAYIAAINDSLNVITSK
jgi:hypothetical protein